MARLGNAAAPLSATTLIIEVADSTFAFNNKIKAGSIKLLWECLCGYVATTLKQQKGVLLPHLGTFRVGPVVGEAKKKIRPCFTLLEGRYGGLSQERGRYVVGGRAPIVQPSYGQLSTQSGIHRGATQRLVAELLQRLGVHILSGRPIRCEFPGLGIMATNRGGRFEFVFDPLIMEHFEYERDSIVREMDQVPDAKEQDVLRRNAHLGNSPYVLSPRLRTPASVAPLPASPPPAPGQGQGEGARQRLLSAQHQPFSGELNQLYKLCKLSDRIQAGTIPRMVLEGFLQREVRGLLSHVDGATMLDLLALHSYGQTKKLIMYLPFLHSLEALVPRQAIPARQPQPESPPEAARNGDGGHKAGPDDQEHNHVADISFNGMLPADPHGGQGQPPQQQHGQHQQHNGNQQQQQAAQQQQGYEVHHPPQYQGYPYPPPAAPEGVSRPVTAPPQPQDYLHYEQKLLSPRSRAEYDVFNRMHFERLYQERGPLHHRAVTPKVGEEPLNMSEYQAVRQAQNIYGQPFPFSAAVSPRGGFRPPSAPGAPRPPAQQNPGGVPGLPPYTSAQPLIAPRAVPPLPQGLQSPPCSFRPQDQVYQILQDPALPAARPVTRPSPAIPQGEEWSPRPRASPPAPISYYDVQRADGNKKERLKAELASELQQGWSRQIQERNEFEKRVERSEQVWPFGLQHVPNDKRPVSAISHPPISPLRNARLAR